MAGSSVSIFRSSIVRGSLLAPAELLWLLSALEPAAASFLDDEFAAFLVPEAYLLEPNLARNSAETASLLFILGIEGT